MKLAELFLDKVIETKLFEMAHSRAKAWEICAGLYSTLTDHLLKILVMPTSVYIPHWKEEVSSYLSKMLDIRVKPKGKRLTAETYHEWLISEPDFDEAVISRRIVNLKKQYQGEKFEVPEDVFEQYQQLMTQICKDLGANIETPI